MSMRHNGLAKLLEECGELSQVAGKILQYPSMLQGQIHIDGKTDIHSLEDEMGDLRAAIFFVIEKLGLDRNRIEARVEEKIFKFRKWDTEP